MIIGATAGILLHNSKPALPDTGEVLAGMLAENTGIHGMDSGGAYGRHWQRNQGMTKADWEALPSGFMMDDAYPVIRAYHYLKDRLIITEASEALNREFRAIYDADPDVMNTDHETLLERMGYESQGGYTYNHDNRLSQDFVWSNFEVGLEWFTVLSTHNGADARGGFSTPYVFAICGANDYWVCDIDRAGLYCAACHISGEDVPYSRVDWYYLGTFDATLPGMGEPDRQREAPEGWEPGHGCPQCEGELEVSIVQSSY